jgi:hypothetical protein
MVYYILEQLLCTFISSMYFLVWHLVLTLQFIADMGLRVSMEIHVAELCQVSIHYVCVCVCVCVCVYLGILSFLFMG